MVMLLILLGKNLVTEVRASASGSANAAGYQATLDRLARFEALEAIWLGIAAAQEGHVAALIDVEEYVRYIRDIVSAGTDCQSLINDAWDQTMPGRKRAFRPRIYCRFCARTDRRSKWTSRPICPASNAD